MTRQDGLSRRRFSLRFSVVTLIVALSCAILSCNRSQNTSNQTSLKVGYSQLRISLPIFVAQEKGIFAKHGIKADLVMYDTAQPMMQALVENRIEVAGYTAMPITYNGMLRSGKSLLFITTMIEDQDHRISYLLRPATKSGEQPLIRNIRDLRGKKIGVLPTSAYAGWLKAILRGNGLDPDKEVVIQPIAPEQEGAALKSGGVDALFTNDPVATATIRKGTAELISNTVECPKYIEDPFPFGSFNVTQKWADEHAELFKNLVAAMDEAVAYVNEHPAESKQAMVAYLPEQFRGDVGSYPDAKYLSTSQSTEATYQHLAELYLKMGIIDKQPALSGLIVNH